MCEQQTCGSRPQIKISRIWKCWSYQTLPIVMVRTFFRQRALLPILGNSSIRKHEISIGNGRQTVGDKILLLKASLLGKTTKSNRGSLTGQNIKRKSVISCFFHVFWREGKPENPEENLSRQGQCTSKL